jgi:hypothetical protein
MYILFKNINIGDTSAQIQLTSGQDFVMINAIVTKLNSQLPDATLRINDIALLCNSRKITIIVFIIQIAPLLSLLQHQLQYMQMDY